LDSLIDCLKDEDLKISVIAMQSVGTKDGAVYARLSTLCTDFRDEIRCSRGESAAWGSKPDFQFNNVD
jgi:hypothetical protein